MAFDWDILKREEIPTLATRVREIEMGDIYESSYAARTKTYELPKDHFIHRIDFRLDIGTLTGGTPVAVAGLSENMITSLKVKADGGKVFKDYLWKEAKELAVLNGESIGYNTSTELTSYNRSYFTDPRIHHVRPLPSWIFTSLQIEASFRSLQDALISTGGTTSAPGTKLVATVYESEWTGQKISGDWPVLIEVVSGRVAKGTSTGWMVFDQTRANSVFGYLLHADDNNVDNDAKTSTIKMIARKPEGTYELVSERKWVNLKTMNKLAQNNLAHATGYSNIMFPNGLATKNFTTLQIQTSVPVAATDYGMRVVERYAL